LILRIHAHHRPGGERDSVLQDGKRLIYQGPLFAVFETDIPLHDGRRKLVSSIDHRPCISVVPVTERGELLLIRQYRHAVDQVLIEIPAGNMDREGESPEECTQRELAEETGFQAGRLIKLFEGYLVPGYGNEYMHYFLALDLFAASLPPDEDESIEVIALPLAEAISMMKRGVIKDSKTALGICLAAEYLREAKEC